MSEDFRDYPEQYKYSNRDDFKIGTRVVFVGPPPDADNLTFIARKKDHKLYHRRGVIEEGKNGSLRCYPDESDGDLSRMVWVMFENDKHCLRQVDCNWLVRIEDFRG